MKLNELFTEKNVELDMIAEYPEDIISSTASKIILGIDETFFASASKKMNVERNALEWIIPRQRLLAQMKSQGDTKTKWVWSYIQ